MVGNNLKITKTTQANIAKTTHPQKEINARHSLNALRELHNF